MFPAAFQTVTVSSPTVSTVLSSPFSGGAPSEGNESDTPPPASKPTAGTSTLQWRRPSGEVHPACCNMDVDSSLRL